MKSAAKTFGILTSGGDCPGLNAAIRGVAKPAFSRYNMNVVGISNGFLGLIEGDARPLKASDVSGILTQGGTILGTSREKPFKDSSDMTVEDKLKEIQKNYEKLKLDCLVVLGGNGTHKTANSLWKAGMNVIGLPKTIDNDLYGTEVTFGFHSAVDIATGVIDRIHSTAQAHNRIMVVEIMGNKAGWLALYAGLAGGGDVILIPEIPYDIEQAAKQILVRAKHGKPFSIVVVAEGAISAEEASLSKKELKKKKSDAPASSVGYVVADQLQRLTGLETRVTIPGYQVRGGSPSPYDRILSTKFGTAAAEMLHAGEYGKMVALEGGRMVTRSLEEVAGKLKRVPAGHPLMDAARLIGTSFGTED